MSTPPPQPQFQPPQAHASDEEEPFEETRPDLPVVPPDENPKRLPTGERRVLEGLALLSLVPILLGLNWLEDSRNVAKSLERPEDVTVVPRGATGTLADTQWRVLGRAAGRTPLSTDPEVAELGVLLEIRPLNAEGVKTVRSYGLGYRFRDPEGRVWMATGRTTVTPRPGVPLRVAVKGVLPRSKASSVSLEVRPPVSPAEREEPRPLLRFSP